MVSRKPQSFYTPFFTDIYTKLHLIFPFIESLRVIHGTYDIAIDMYMCLNCRYYFVVVFVSNAYYNCVCVCVCVCM